VALEIEIVRAALRKDVSHGVAHQFADPQLTLRAVGGGIAFARAWHH
jgi:hypothetical protein